MDFIGLIAIIFFIMLISSATGSQKKAKMQEMEKREALRRYYENMNAAPSPEANRPPVGKPHYEWKPAKPAAEYISETEQDSANTVTSSVHKQKVLRPSHAQRVLADLPSAIIASEIFSKPRALRKFR